MLKGSNVFPKGREASASATVAEIYEEHFDRVWRWVQALGVRDADLEDAVHDVFVVVHRRIGEFEGRAKITTWLFGIAMRVASDFRRRAHTRREQSGEDLDLFDDGERLPPDEAASQAQSRALVRRVLEGLDDNKRAAFVLYEIEGLTAQQIAELMGCPAQTVYSRLRVAREYFRAEVLRHTDAPRRPR